MTGLVLTRRQIAKGEFMYHYHNINLFKAYFVGEIVYVEGVGQNKQLEQELFPSLITQLRNADYRFIAEMNHQKHLVKRYARGKELGAFAVYGLKPEMVTMIKTPETFHISTEASGIKVKYTKPTEVEFYGEWEDNLACFIEVNYIEVIDEVIQELETPLLKHFNTRSSIENNDDIDD